MRKIKFRAWNDLLKSMYNVSELHVDSDGKLKELGKFKTISMQFTGLKDKNGVDIYEGDIVAKYDKDQCSDEYKVWSDNVFFEGDIDERLESLIPIVLINSDIVTMERFPCYWLKNEQFGYEGDDLQWHGEYSVIGNIHENKDLLP